MKLWPEQLLKPSACSPLSRTVSSWPGVLCYLYQMGNAQSHCWHLRPDHPFNNTWATTVGYLWQRPELGPGWKPGPNQCKRAWEHFKFVDFLRYSHHWSLVPNNSFCLTYIYGFRPLKKFYLLDQCPSHYLCFYLRPVLAFGYCHYLCLCVCVSVHVCVRVPTPSLSTW